MTVTQTTEFFFPFPAESEAAWQFKEDNPNTRMKYVIGGVSFTTIRTMQGYIKNGMYDHHPEKKTGEEIDKWEIVDCPEEQQED